MKHKTLALTALIIGLSASVFGVAPADAQKPGITLALMAGVGGSVDEDTDYSNTSWQALFSYDLQIHRTFSIRAGQLDIESDRAIPPLREATLSYVNLGGEFEFPESFYDAGIFLGLGYYDLDSTFGADNFGANNDGAVGIAVGTSAKFKITPRASVLVEFSGHFADLDAAQFFVMANAGFAWHF